MIGFGAGCYVVIGFTILQSLVAVQDVADAIAVMTIGDSVYLLRS